MPIRNEEDVMSRAIMQEKEWFEKVDRFQTDLDRWVYMEKGTRDGSWEFRKKISEMENLDDTEFLITDPKFVNRPDAIAYKFYGNAKFWWIIAERNEILDPFTGFYKGRKLKIPAMERLRSEVGL